MVVLVIGVSIKPPIAGVAQRSGRYCDAHHEMSDLGAACEPDHSGGESVEPGWQHTSETLARDGWRRS